MAVVEKMFAIFRDTKKNMFLIVSGKVRTSTNVSMPFLDNCMLHFLNMHHTDWK